MNNQKSESTILSADFVGSCKKSTIEKTILIPRIIMLSEIGTQNAKTATQKYPK